MGISGCRDGIANGLQVAVVSKTSLIDMSLFAAGDGYQ